jgi:hypothetical protein
MNHCIRCIIPRNVIFSHQSFRILDPDPQYSRNDHFSEIKKEKQGDVFEMYISSYPPALLFQRKVLKSCLVLGMYSTGNLPVLVSTVTEGGKPEPEPSFIEEHAALGTVKAVCTRCKLVRTYQLAGMRMQRLQSSTCRTFHVSFSRLASQHLHNETRMKCLSTHSRKWSGASQLASCTCGLSLSFTCTTLANVMNKMFRT